MDSNNYIPYQQSYKYVEFKWESTLPFASTLRQFSTVYQ